MEDIHTRINKFIKNLRLQADEYEDVAVKNEKHRPSFTVKLCGMAHANREIADKMEEEFEDIFKAQ